MAVAVSSEQETDGAYESGNKGRHPAEPQRREVKPPAHMTILGSGVWRVLEKLGSECELLGKMHRRWLQRVEGRL